MKKVINGKLYDTQTPQELGSWWNGSSDFSICWEYLYKKKTGEYFLYGKGGATSKYARSWGNTGSQSGESVIPLTEAEARSWAEQKLDADEYIEIFGGVEE